MKLLVTAIVFSISALSSNNRCFAAYNIYSSPSKPQVADNSLGAQKLGNSAGSNFRSSEWRSNEIDQRLPDDERNLNRMVVSSSNNINNNNAGDVRFVVERTTPRFAYRLTTASVGNLATADFANDEEIHDYLRESDTDAMIWSCQNYIQVDWRGRAIPFVDLMCDVIGEVKSLEVSFKGRKLDFMKSGSRYSLSASPMRTGDGRFSNSWLRYRIRIHNAMRRDSGKYEIQLLSAQNRIDKQVVIVDIRKAKTAISRT